MARIAVRALVGAGVCLALVFALMPFAWMLLSSFKTQAQNLAAPPEIIFTPTLANYIAVFRDNPFAEYALNSVIVGLASTALSLAVGLPAAFSIARYRQGGISQFILLMRMVPTIGLLIPWFVLFSRFNLIGTHAALILSHLTITLPFTVWVMIGFFEDVPGELLDAARVDGCSVYGTLWRIVLPVSLPGIAVTGIFAFTYSWNNFLLSLVMGGLKTRTLPVAVYNFMSYGWVEWGGIMAGSTIVILPMGAVVLFVQRYIVSGLSLGALKG